MLPPTAGFSGYIFGFECGRTTLKCSVAIFSGDQAFWHSMSGGRAQKYFTPMIIPFMEGCIISSPYEHLFFGF